MAPDGRSSGAAQQYRAASLPPYSPELNPVENIGEFLRQNDFSNRVYATYEAIVEVCCVAWNKLIAAPGRIRSIATREWARTVNS
jgi:transposase